MNGLLLLRHSSCAYLFSKQLLTVSRVLFSSELVRPRPVTSSKLVQKMPSGEFIFSLFVEVSRYWLFEHLFSAWSWHSAWFKSSMKLVNCERCCFWFDIDCNKEWIDVVLSLVVDYCFFYVICVYLCMSLAILIPPGSRV